METRKLDINIPAGITEGKILRVPNEGNHIAKSKGDLKLHIKIDSPLPGSPGWERKGADVWHKVEIPYTTLVLGGSTTVETIWGPEILLVSPKTRCGEIISMGQKGFPRHIGKMMPDERGSYLVIIDLKIPNRVSAEHRTSLEQLKIHE